VPRSDRKRVSVRPYRCGVSIAIQCDLARERMSKTQKETIEYDAKFLAEWNTFCDSKGYVKRQATHACRIAFMKSLSAEEREAFMSQAAQRAGRSGNGRS